LAVILAVVGQIFSVFLAERAENGKIRLRGGAGGATTMGGAIALWPVSLVVILPLVLVVYFGIGYASITTISIAFFSLIFFTYNAVAGFGPWPYLLYGLVTLGIVLYTLQPNLERLKNGTERAVGIRAFLQKRWERTLSSEDNK
jgi:glycerol-3-phosphate acyltransferase PlsY